MNLKPFGLFICKPYPNMSLSAYPQTSPTLPKPSQEEEEVDDAGADGERRQEGQPRLRLVREDERPPAGHRGLHLGREAAPLRREAGGAEGGKGKEGRRRGRRRSRRNRERKGRAERRRKGE